MPTQGAPALSTTIDDRILVRGRDLADELIGRLTFTEMFLLDLHGEEASAPRVRMVDAVLVALMEHGITPSTLAARLVMDGAPESTQGALAAGLLATGSRFLGVVEEVAAFVQVVAVDVAGGDLHSAARRHVASALSRSQRIPGFGHNLHDREDPRVGRLLALASEEGVTGDHIAALHAVHTELQEQTAQPLILNAAGVVGALLTDLGYAPSEVRGFALVARCAGLFAHVIDELRQPIARQIWQRSHEAVRRAEQ